MERLGIIIDTDGYAFLVSPTALHTGHDYNANAPSTSSASTVSLEFAENAYHPIDRHYLPAEVMSAVSKINSLRDANEEWY